MPAYYVDSSALVKRYIREIGSTWIAGVIDDPAHDIYISRLAGVEVAATIIRRAERRLAARQLKHFRSDFAANYIVINLTARHFDRAIDLAEKHRLRGADALQLAVALDAAQVIHIPLVVLAADQELLAAARDEGLGIDNPNDHP